MFVTFEGPEGAGKSTVVREIADRIQALGLKCVVTREPGGGQIGPKIRQILLEGTSISPLTELFLFLADRSEHVNSVIRPALEGNNVVLCDRFADSTVVYQGYGRGIEIERLKELNQLACDGLRPDLVLLLDLPVEIGLSRIDSKDRLDREPIEFHQRVRQGFLKEAEQDPLRWHVIDARNEPDEVAKNCWKIINERLAVPKSQ